MTVKKPESGNGRRVRYLLIMLFVIMAGAILVTSYVYYQNYEKNYKIEIDHQLTAVSDLKVNELVNWKTERLGDVGTFFHNPVFSSRIRHILNDTNDTGSQEEVHTWLEKELGYAQYNRVYMMDATGTTRMSVPGIQRPVATTVSRQLPLILESGNITIIDFYRDDYDQKIYLTIIVPVYDDQEGGTPLGFVAFQVDPELYLYPFINEWPGPSPSAETLIVRREGNDAVYLNDLRFNNNSALALRIPLDRTDVPAIRAALGEEGIVEGKDYRGIPVIANIRKIPDTPWFLVARIDTSEVYGPLREQFLLLIGIVAILLIGIGTGIGMIWRGESTRYYKAMYESEKEVRKEREKARSYLEIVGATVLGIGTDQAVFMINPAGCRLLGRPEGDILGRNWFDNFLPDRLRETSRDRFIEMVNGATGQPDIFENVIVTAGGEERIVSWHIILIRDENQKITGTLRSGEDVTDRIRAEEDILLLGRMVDDAPVSIVIHDFDEKILYVNEETLRLHGYSREEFLAMDLHTLDAPETVDLINERMQQVYSRGEADFDVYHYRKDGSSFPLHANVKIINWGGREVMLSIATDLTERKNMEDRLERQNDELQAANEELTATQEELKAQFDELIAIQKELWKSEERYRLTLDATNDGIWDWDIPTGEAFFSPHWYTMLGYEPGEMPGSYDTWRSLVHPDDLPEAERKIQGHTMKDEGYTVEFRMRVKQGGWRWILSRGRVVERDSEENPVRMVGTHTDITERKRIEDTLLRVNQKLNVLSQLTRADLTSQIFILNGYLELARKQAAGLAPVIESIKKVEHAAWMINEITQFTRDYQDMGSKPPVWQNVRFAFLFGISHLSLGKIRHTIETGDLEIFADPLLEKACQGLFENSLAHGDHVTIIRVWHTITPAGVTIFYEDDGIGIPIEEKEKIFSRREGLNATVRGLFFIREILDITGIGIRETGEPGKGARFEIYVPNGGFR